LEQLSFLAPVESAAELIEIAVNVLPRTLGKGTDHTISPQCQQKNNQGKVATRTKKGEESVHGNLFVPAWIYLSP